MKKQRVKNIIIGDNLIGVGLLFSVSLFVKFVIKKVIL